MPLFALFVSLLLFICCKVSADQIRIATLISWHSHKLSETFVSTVNYLNFSFPQHSFQLVSLEEEELWNISASSSNDLDFVFVDPALFSCFELQNWYRAILTIENEAGQERIGGAILVPQDSALQLLSDFRTESLVIGTPSFSQLDSFLLQWNEFAKQGVDLFHPTNVFVLGNVSSPPLIASFSFLSTFCRISSGWRSGTIIVEYFLSPCIKSKQLRFIHS